MSFQLITLAICAVPFLLMAMLFHETMQQQQLEEDGRDNNEIRGDNRGERGAFGCYTCNVQAGQDNTEPCQEKAEECPTASALLPAAPFNSCSTLLHFTAAGSLPAAELQPSDAAEGGVTARVRKFCTSAGSAEFLAPLLTRLAENGGAGGICQPLDSWARLSADPLLPSIVEGTTGARLPMMRKKGKGGRRERRDGGEMPMANGGGEERHNKMPKGRMGRATAKAGPPAPPTSQSSSSILCVCTKSFCNEGDFEDILSKSIYVAGMGGEQRRK